MTTSKGKVSDISKRVLRPLSYHQCHPERRDQHSSLKIENHPYYCQHCQQKSRRRLAFHSTWSRELTFRILVFKTLIPLFNHGGFQDSSKQKVFLFGVIWSLNKFCSWNTIHICRSHHLIYRLSRLELHLTRCCVYTLRDLSLNAQQDRTSEMKKYVNSKDLITNRQKTALK